MARIDYERAASTYDIGRALPPRAFANWPPALDEFWPRDLPGSVVDVGAGTGIWCKLLAEWFQSPVVGIEPAAGMRKVAASKPLPTSAAIVAGTGGAIPLRDRSCKAAWLSTVIHHIPDLPSCALELRRVLRSGGVVLIRSAFPGRHDEHPLFRFFPGARRIAGTFPTVEATVAVFEAAGFRFRALRRIHEVRYAEPAEMVERVRAMRHADSTLAPLSSEEFAEGLAALEEAAASMNTVPPTGLDLLVLR